MNRLLPVLLVLTALLLNPANAQNKGDDKGDKGGGKKVPIPAQVVGMLVFGATGVWTTVQMKRRSQKKAPNP